MRFERDGRCPSPIKLVRVTEVDADRSVAGVVDSEPVAWITSRHREADDPD